MRFIILNTDYWAFLESMYAQHPGLDSLSYDDQQRVRNESLFGVADFYSFNLRALGHEALDIHVNNERMQSAWMREHGLLAGAPPTRGSRRVAAAMRGIARRTPLRRLKPLLSRTPPVSPWSNAFYRVLAEQIRHYRPDVLLNQAMDGIAGEFLAEMKPYVRLMVGQTSAPLPEDLHLRPYDLVLSALPSFVERFRNEGLPSELHRFAFEPRIARRLDGDAGAARQLSFVGSLSRGHSERRRLLEHLSASCVPIRIWGAGVEHLDPDSPIRSRHAGTAWGIEMYRVFRNSLMTLNNHGGLAESYAVNMRLFEATGVGTLLVTDAKQNLREMFEPGKEVVTYRNPQECVEVIQHYLDHDDERRAIADAGHRRTLRDHTYVQRAEELADLVKRHV